MSASALTSQQIKLAILRHLSTTFHGDYKYNIIGKADAPVGAIERLLNVRLTHEQRHLASKCFDDLRTDDLIRPTYTDSSYPEDWVAITEAGLEALKKGRVDDSAARSGGSMNERLRKFLKELAETRGREYYHPESNDEEGLRKFQGEVDEIRELEEINVLKIVGKPHKESYTGHDYVDLIGVELTGAGVKWLNSQNTVASADNQGIEAQPKAVGIVMASDAKNVFVVHGRNLEARTSIFRFLRAIGLRPLEWSQAIQETGKASPFIGEILDVAFTKAQAVVVLLTPDDEARLREPFRGPSEPAHETELTGQARPNVLFEAGMAMGRNPDRTIIVELGKLRPFSDIAGRHMVKLSNDSAARHGLVLRLQTAGCAVELTGSDWHTEGDFDIQVAEVRRPDSPTPARSQTPASEYDESDIISMIGNLLDKRRKDYERFLIRYSEIDEELGVEAGSTKNHAEEAARRFGYSVDEKGGATMTLHKTPPGPARLVRG